jgi:glycosidase
VHPNYKAVNVEKESRDANSLLNTLRSILKIRKEQAALREGNLIWMDNLPGGILGYKRQTDKDEITVVLNFTEKKSEFQLAEEGLQSLFQLSGEDSFNAGRLKLNGLSGMILRMVNK